MGNYLSQALWAEYYKGVDIWTYINEAENNEYLRHRGVDEAVYKWMQTPCYESDRKVYRAIADAVQPLIDKGIMQPKGLRVVLELDYDLGEVTLDLEVEVGGEDTFYIDGPYHTVPNLVKEFVSSIINSF